MEEVGHSTLLKFFVTEKKIPTSATATMSVPQLRVQVSSENPDIESEVPGEQELRDTKTNHTISETNMDAKQIDENPSNAEGTEENAKEGTTDKEDYVLSPVITVTKQESVFTKGDLKLQKITVTEDISDNHIQTSVSHERVILTNNGQQEGHNEVMSAQYMRRDMHTEKEKAGTKKPRSRIPLLRFRQAVEQVKKERRSNNEKENEETQPLSPRRSSIPRLKDSRIPPPNILTHQLSQKSEKSEPSPRLDDEFEKLYDDLVDENDSDETLSIASRIEDPVKLDNTFEEIIHAYEEKAQPTTVEKVKVSKIPLLKRKSEQEIDVSKLTTSVQNMSSRTSSQTSELVTEKQSKIQSVTLNSPIRTSTVSKSITEAKSAHESSAQTFESFKTVRVSSIEETNNSLTIDGNKTTDETWNSFTRDFKEENVKKIENIEVVSAHEGTITETTETKESVKVATPVFDNLWTNDSILSEFNKKSETMSEIKMVNVSKESSAFVQEDKNSTVSTSFIKTNFEDTQSGSINRVSSTTSTSDYRVDETIENDLSLSKHVTSQWFEANDTKINNSYNEESIINTINTVETMDYRTDKSNMEQTQSIEHVTTKKEAQDDIGDKNDKEQISNINRDHNKSKEEFTTQTIESKTINDEDQVTSIKHVTVTKTIETKDSKLDETQEQTTIQEVTTIKSIEDSSYIDNPNDTNDHNKDTYENKDEEDIPILKGKVSRIIRRIDSIDTDAKPPTKSVEDDLCKPKSVISKIAMFERPEATEPPPRAKVRCISQIPRPKTDNTDSTQGELPDNKPKVVEEVLKALPARIIHEDVITARATQEDVNENIGKDVNASKTENINNETVWKSENDAFDIQIIDIKPKVAVEVSNEVQFESNDNGQFDIQIIDIQPDVPVIESVEINDNDIKESNNLNNDGTAEISVGPSLVEFKVPPEIIQNDKERNNSNQHYGTNGTQEIDFRPDFIKTAPEDILNKRSFKVSSKNDHRNNRSKILSDSKTKPFNRVQSEDKKVENINENGLYRRSRKDEGQLRIHSYRNNQADIKMKSKSLAELDLGDAVKGKVRSMIVRMNSLERIDLGKKEIIDIKERPRSRSVSEKIALFERKLTPYRLEKYEPQKNKTEAADHGLSEEEFNQKVQELVHAKTKYGTLDQALMKYMELRDGSKMPVIGIGTALVHPKLTRYVVQAAIDLGYRLIDTAFIYGNEKEVGEAIQEKIKDGTVTREELFIISKLWSTFHRRDLVEKACRASLEAMGLDYFDLYLIHNPVSFKEGRDPIPRIASVIQFSEHDYLDAWYGMEDLVRKGLIKRGGVSNFNSVQVDRIVEKAKIKPVVNQVECHPYLSQNRLEDFCQARGVKLSCYGVLGSKGTPEEYTSGLPPVIDDPLVRVMAAGLEVTPATLLIGYQLSLGRNVIVKASSAAHLWDNLAPLSLSLSPADVSGLHALNRNKRIFTFKGLGDTHKNYPFNIPF